jgi:hypothetical protein
MPRHHLAPPYIFFFSTLDEIEEGELEGREWFQPFGATGKAGVPGHKNNL